MLSVLCIMLNLAAQTAHLSLVERSGVLNLMLFRLTCYPQSVKNKRCSTKYVVLLLCLLNWITGKMIGYGGKKSKF